MGTGKRIDVHVHKGAGAYICGEETALMNSLEGRRGNPRIKPPFPAVSGVFGMPTTINNVETLIAAAPILLNAAEWYKKLSLASPKSTGTKLYSVCGNVQRPGTYEVVMGFPFKEFLYDLCGGPLHGRKFKAVIPGGASVPIQTLDEAEATLMDYEGFVAQGSMLGSGGVIVIDDAQPMVTVIARIARFFAHESCGQCTQCREGTARNSRGRRIAQCGRSPSPSAAHHLSRSRHPSQASIPERRIPHNPSAWPRPHPKSESERTRHPESPP